MMFSDRYIQKVVNTKSHLCVGLDPILENFPSYILKTNFSGGYYPWQKEEDSREECRAT